MYTYISLYVYIYTSINELRHRQVAIGHYAAPKRRTKAGAEGDYGPWYAVAPKAPQPPEASALARNLTLKHTDSCNNTLHSGKASLGHVKDCAPSLDKRITDIALCALLWRI